MEADEGQLPERLNLVLPLPYRILVIFLLGIWGFGVNVHVLSLYGIDTASLLHYKPRFNTSAGLHASIYSLGFLISAIVTLSLLVFWILCGADPSNVYEWQVFPLLTAFATFLIMVNPLDVFHRYGRFQFWRYCQRVSVGAIDLETRFADILLADALTSYAKVLGDCWILTCMFLTRLPTTAQPNRACGGTLIVPIIMCLPSLARLRQCLTEYFATGCQNSTHAWNALKYASVFPVILISSFQFSVDEYTNPEERNLQTFISRIWLICAFFNSIFSFYWDVANDWDLNFFAPTQKTNAYRRLRSPLFFSPVVYYFAICLDLILRMTWSLKLSPHLIEVYEYEGGIFILEVLEVMRRWMWVFFRVEAEQIRRVRNHGVAASNGIELLSNVNEEYLD